jgi:hypothetical protein
MNVSVFVAMLPPRPRRIADLVAEMLVGLFAAIVICVLLGIACFFLWRANKRASVKRGAAQRATPTLGRRWIGQARRIALLRRPEVRLRCGLNHHGVNHLRPIDRQDVAAAGIDLGVGARPMMAASSLGLAVDFWCPAVLAHAQDQGLIEHAPRFEIEEVPIRTYYGDEICYVNGLAYARDVVGDSARYALRRRGFGSHGQIITGNYFHDNGGASGSVLSDIEPGLVFTNNVVTGSMFYVFLVKGPNTNTITHNYLESYVDWNEISNEGTWGGGNLLRPERRAVPRQ